MHLTAPHLAFALAVVPLSALLVASATLLRPLARTGYGYLTIACWSLFLLCGHGLDVLRTPAAALPWLTVAVVLLAAVVGSLFSRGALGRYGEANRLSDALELWLAWLLGFAAALVPRLTMMPPGTVVWGHFVCNDGVAHSLYALGEDYLHQDGISRTLLSTYPRGFHSFLRLAASALGDEPPALILPATLFCHSLSTVFAWHVLDTAGVRSRVVRVVLSAAAATAFLNLLSAYLLFSSQAAVVPLLLAWAFRQLQPAARPSPPVLQWAILIAALTTYGVFPLSVLFLTLLLQLGEARGWPARLLAGVRARSWRRIVPWAAVLLTGLPAMVSLVLFAAGMWTGTDRAAGIWRSPGNLFGYLSPLHMAGFWSSAVDYRARFDQASYRLEYWQLLLLLVELAVVLLLPFGRRSLRFLACFALPWFLLPLLSVTEYFHFKYFALMLGGFQAVAFACLALWATGKPRPLAWGHLLACALALVLVTQSVRSFPAWPIVPQRELARFERLREVALSQGRTLVLTKEDWLRPYRTGHDDWYPLILYYPVPYQGERPDFVVLDGRYPEETKAFLARFPNIAAAVNEQYGWCRLLTIAHFTVFSRTCGAAP